MSGARNGDRIRGAGRAATLVVASGIAMPVSIHLLGYRIPSGDSARPSPSPDSSSR